MREFTYDYDRNNLAVWIIITVYAILKSQFYVIKVTNIIIGIIDKKTILSKFIVIYS